MTTIPKDVLDKLGQFDTPTISNVIELFEVRSRTAGYMDGRIRACFPDLPPVVGFAANATCRTAISPRSGDAYHRLPHQVERFEELSGPPIVVFQDLDNPVVAATFGEIMCTTYQAFGAAGLITNGGGRDLEQVRTLGFPVFTGSTICSHGYIAITSLHEPVRVGGLAVYPDDLLHGDLNGVLTIPRSIAADVADVAAELVAAERIILDTLHQAPGNLRRLREAVAAADEQLDALRQRVRARKIH